MSGLHVHTGKAIHLFVYALTNHHCRLRQNGGYAITLLGDYGSGNIRVLVLL